MHIASSYNLVYSKSLFKRRSMNLCIRKCKCKCKYAKILLNRVHSWWEILNRKWTETQTNCANFLLRHTIQSLISHIEARDTQTVKIRALYISTLLLMYQKDGDYFYWFKKKSENMMKNEHEFGGWSFKLYMCEKWFQSREFFERFCVCDVIVM